MPDAWEHKTYRQGIALIHIVPRKLRCQEGTVREVLIKNIVSVCAPVGYRLSFTTYCGLSYCKSVARGQPFRKAPLSPQ